MTSASKNTEVEICTSSRSKDGERKCSATSDSNDLPTIIRREKSVSTDGPQGGSQRNGEKKGGSERPELLDEHRDINYERWKKKTCCHQFSSPKLEEHFWIFYMENHTKTIRIVLAFMFIFPVVGWMVVDYFQLEEGEMDVFWHLFYLRLLWSLVILVFLVFFQIGLSEKDAADAKNRSESQLSSRSLSSLKSSDKLRNTDEAINEVEQGSRRKDRRSWYSRLGALTVEYSFGSVFTVCFLVSCISIIMSYIGNRPSHKPYIMWFIVIHIFCGLGNRASSCLCWMTTILYALINGLLDHPNDNPYKTCAYVVCVSTILSVMGEFLEFSYRKLYYKRSELEVEQYKNEVMLTHVVPPRIAIQLQRGEREAVKYADEPPNFGASVLFCQICDFEDLSNNLPASALVNYLNKVFTKIDALSARRNVYKVETVKEVYMAAAGLPQPDSDHMNQIAHFALDIKERLIENPKSLAIDDLPELKSPTLKLGINCGNVIAGVIGKLCPRYRLFGDTVNVAARMETNSVKGKIQITKKFYSRIDHNIFITESRGIIQIKGKDAMETYFLTGRREGAFNVLPEEIETSVPSVLSSSEHGDSYYNGISMLAFCQQAGMMNQQSSRL